MYTKIILGSVLASALALPAMAGSQVSAPLYPYNSGANNCPAGLQPIVMGGVICCGEPNRSQSYASMMSQPAKKKVYRKRVVRHVVRDTCAEGMKGCY